MALDSRRLRSAVGSQREDALRAEGRDPRPRAAPVGRAEEQRRRGGRARHRRVGGARGHEDAAGIVLVHGDRVDGDAAAAAGVGGVVGEEDAVAVVADRSRHGVLRRVRQDHAPRAAGVVAAVDGLGAGVDRLRPGRVEGEGRRHRAEVEHAPGRAAVAREVGAGHVAAEHDDLRVVRADGGPTHRPAAAGADDPPGVEPRGARRAERVGAGQGARRGRERRTAGIEGVSSASPFGSSRESISSANGHRR